MWDFYRHSLTGVLVSGAKNGRHAAAGNQLFNHIMVEFVAGVERAHGLGSA
jgi:hypothetical protein